MFDFSHPMFKPIWVRVLIVFICFGCASFEYSRGAQVWGLLFAAFGGISIWGLFIDYPPKEKNKGPKSGEE
ncbi:MAG: DUF3329 domain-containing protein [Pseudomonadota bacterium]